MSVYRKKGSQFYYYDFWLRNRRFHGSTLRTNRREAEAVERAERDRAKQQLAIASASASKLTIDVAAGRYWTEVGQHHAGADNTWRDLSRLVDYFGPCKDLNDITDNDVAKLVQWRRAQRVVRTRKTNANIDDPFVSNATVNRSSTEVLKKLFSRAKAAWGFRFDHEPNWKVHRLPEPVERVRELHDAEAARLEEATRDDYAPFFDFARASGARLNECLLKWSEVNFETGQIRKLGKGGKYIVIPITDVVRSILWPLRGHDHVHVFTYVARRNREGRIKGQRYPITYNGAKAMWKRIRKAAAVQDFRFHDFRHSLATKLLRESGNLKLVQKALNHSDIKTTTRYAHVLVHEVATALDAVQKSRKKSRNRSRKAG